MNPREEQVNSDVMVPIDWCDWPADLRVREVPA